MYIIYMHMYCCYCWAINYKNNKHADGRIPRLILAHIQLISRQICTAARNVSRTQSVA